MWLLGLLSNSIGILIGGCIAWGFKGLQNKINNIYVLCAGLILGLICIEIFPESIELGGWLISVIWLIVGMLTFSVLHNLLNHEQPLKSTSFNKKYLQTGLLLMFSISIHNFPIGIIIWTSTDADFTFSVLQTLLFHSIPEGIILFSPLMLAGIKNLSLLVVPFLVSIPVALGVYVGSFIGSEYMIISASLISFTVGIIFMVTVSEILLPIMEKAPLHKILFLTLIGIGIMGLYLHLI
ncbi:Zinc transporter ZupT [Ureibacillus acetophenoni]